MRWLRMATRWLGVLLYFSLPMSALGAAIQGRVGALVMAALSLALLAYLAIAAEKRVARIHGAKIKPTSALEWSLKRVIEQMGGIAPRILIFPDPAPNAVIARSPFGRGVICLSQGLLVQLEEDELRAILAHLIFRLRTSETLLNSTLAILSAGVYSWAPASWVRCWVIGDIAPRERGDLHLSARSSFLFFLFFALARSVLALSVRGRSDDPMSPAYRAALASALNKIDNSNKFWDLNGNPGMIPLYLVYPWSRISILRPSRV